MSGVADLGARPMTVRDFEVHAQLRCPGCRRRLSIATGMVDWMWPERDRQGRVGVREVRTCKDEACVAWREARQKAWVCSEPAPLVWLDAAPPATDANNTLNSMVLSLERSRR